MSCKCSICNHRDRAEIENAILQMTTADSPERRASLDQIGKQFDLTTKDQLNELKMHALFHMPLGFTTESDVQVNPAAPNSNSANLNSADSNPNSDLNCAANIDSNAAEFGEQFASGATVPGGRMSLARKMKLHEADMLTAVNHEYLVTLKTVGRRINKLVATKSVDGEDDEAAIRAAKWLTKPMVDLYLGLNAEIRKNVATLTDVDRALNGPQDSASTGLAALAEAIRASNPISEDD